MSLRLLSYNIRYGGAGRETRLAEVIRASAPDLVVLQEATQPRVVEQLAAQAGMRTWGARPGHSLAFMARLEIAHHEWHRPVQGRHPFLEIAPSDGELRVFGLHLSAIHSNWTERRRVRELGALLASIERHQHGFHLLAGDFNTLAPGELLDVRRLPARLRPLVWLSGGRIRWRTIQIMLDGGYVDGYRTLHPTGKGYTFPSLDPHVRLDYVFVPASFTGRLKACEVVGGPGIAEASDHLPLMAEVEVP